MRITILFLLVGQIASAQFGSYPTWDYVNQSAVQRQHNDAKQKPWIDSARNSKVYKYVYVSYKLGKGVKMKMTDSTISTKSSHGYYDHTISYDSKGRPFWEMTVGRNAESKMLYYQKKYYRKTKESQTVAYSYNSDGLLIDATTFNGDSSKIDVRDVLAYDAAGNNSGQMHYNKNKLRQRMAFEYYDDGEKKATKYYTPKGKLSYVTNYECKSVGVTQLPKQKDTTTVCVRSQRDELGRRMEISEYAYGGKMSKYINYFDSLDQMVESVSYNYKNEIATRWKEVEIDKNHSQTVVYKKGGKEILHIYDYVSNPDGYTSTFLSKGVKPLSITKGYNFKRE